MGTNTYNPMGALIGKPYLKAAGLDVLTQESPTDDSIERLTSEWVEDSRAAIKWYSANNDHLMSIIETKVAGVIGSGINIQSRIKNEKELNQSIEETIAEFSEDENCEVTGRWHLNGALRAMVTFAEKDGGFLVRHHYDSSWSLGYKFELISVNMIDIGKNINGALNGIKKDKFGKLESVWIYTDHEKTQSKEVSAKELIYFSPVWVSIEQYTAISKLVSILPSIEKLDKYIGAELNAAIEKAKAGKYWKTSLYDDIIKMVNDMVRNASTDETRMAARNEIKEIMATLSKQGVKPHGLSAIPLGDEVVTERDTTDTIYPALSKTTRNSASAATGQAGIITGQDPSDANYSAMKGVMGLTEINWSIAFDDLQNRVIEKIMREVIKAAVSVGKLNISDFWQNPRKYYKLEYMRVTGIDIEPSKTADANEKNIQNGLTTPREIAKKRNRDIEDIIREKIEDEIYEEKLREEMRKKAGIPARAKQDDQGN